MIGCCRLSASVLVNVSRFRDVVCTGGRWNAIAIRVSVSHWLRLWRRTRIDRGAREWHVRASAPFSRQRRRQQ